MTKPGKEGLPIDPRIEETEALRKLKVIGRLKEEERISAVTPETVTEFWRTRLEIDGARTGLRIKVPDCNWTQEEISKPMLRRGSKEPIAIAGRMLYLPKELTGREGLIRLGKIYSQLTGRRAEGSYTLDEDTKESEWVTNFHDTFGWIKVEATSITPNRNTTEEQLRIFANEHGYDMQREAVYILASIASKDLTNHFFDEINIKEKNRNSWSRLGGSHGGGGVIAACFHPEDGHLRVLLAVDPKQQDDHYGGRFEQPLRR
jgi:hypothetical protein